MNDHADADDADREDTPETGDAADAEATRDRDDHLAGVEAGAGCTEIWEYLSERRSGNGDGEPEE